MEIELASSAQWGGTFFLNELETGDTPQHHLHSSLITVSGNQDPSTVNVHKILGEGRKFGLVGLWARGKGGKKFPAALREDGTLVLYEGAGL